MKAIDYIDELLKNDWADLSSDFMSRVSPTYVDVVVAPFKKLMPWLADHGFALIPPKLGVPSVFSWMNRKDNVVVTIQEAFGGKISTGFPAGWPQKIRAMVTAGFIDLGSSALGRMIKRKKNPGTHSGRYHEASTFREWMNRVNGMLLRDIGLGSWQLTKQPYQQWFVEGMKPGTAANIVIDGVSTGQIKRRYKRSSR